MSGPDSGYAWCVAFAACAINFIMAGLGRMSGILYVAFIESFQIDRRQAAVPFSVRSSLRNLLGPIVGILGQKFGVRAVAISGGILGFLSSGACFYAPNINLITAFWGVLNGASTALTVTLNQVVISQYFKKYRTTASGLSFSGGCVGAFLFPVLLEMLLRTYGTEGTFLVMSGIIMHCIPAAMILRKPPWLKSEKSSKINTAQKQESSGEHEEKEVTDNNTFTVATTKTDNNTSSVAEKVTDNVNLQYLRKNWEVVLKLLSIQNSDATNITTESTADEMLLSEKLILIEIENIYSLIEKYRALKIISNSPSTENSNFFHRSYEKIITAKNFLSNKAKNFTLERTRSSTNKLQPVSPIQIQFLSEISKKYEKDARACLMAKLKTLEVLNKDCVVSEFPENMSSLVLQTESELRKLFALLVEIDSTKNSSEENRIHQSKTSVNRLKQLYSNAPKEMKDGSNNLLSYLKTAVYVHKNPLFLLVCFCRAAHLINFVPAVTTIVDFAMDKGLPEEDGKYVIAALSFGDLMGRLCLGWITDRGYASLPKYMLVVMLLQAFSTACLPIVNSKGTLLSVLALFAMLQGSLFVRHPVLVSRYVENHEHSIAMGCTNFMSGFIGLILPFYIGYFRDIVGSYNGIYFINSIICACIGLMWSLEPRLLRYWKAELSDANTNSPNSV